jgi:ribosomal protein S18 acetylase RimI-like enzyme
MSYVVKRLTADDHPRIMALWEAAGLHCKPQGRDTRKAFAAQLGSGIQTALGVEDEAGRLIGVVLTTHDSRKGWINRLAVHPASRRRGIARKLVAAAEHALQEQGLHIIAALIEPGNEESVTFFEAVGYVDWPGMHYVSKRDSDEV